MNISVEIAVDLQNPSAMIDSVHFLLGATLLCSTPFSTSVLGFRGLWTQFWGTPRPPYMCVLDTFPYTTGRRAPWSFSLSKIKISTILKSRLFSSFSQIQIIEIWPWFLWYIGEILVWYRQHLVPLWLKRPDVSVRYDLGTVFCDHLKIVYIV